MPGPDRFSPPHMGKGDGHDSHQEEEDFQIFFEEVNGYRQEEYEDYNCDKTNFKHRNSARDYPFSYLSCLQISC